MSLDGITSQKQVTWSQLLVHDNTTHILAYAHHPRLNRSHSFLPLPYPTHPPFPGPVRFPMPLAEFRTFSKTLSRIYVTNPAQPNQTNQTNQPIDQG